MIDNQPKNYTIQHNDLPYHGDEFPFSYYLQILWNWKWLVIIGTLICTAAATVATLQIPKVYVVSATIKPAMAGYDKVTRTFKYIDAPEQVIAKIRSGFYNTNIQKAIGRDLLTSVDIAFTTNVLPGTNTLAITSKWQEGNTDLGVKATSMLLRLIAEDYQETVELMKRDHTKQINRKIKEAENIQMEIQLQESILADIRQRNKGIRKEVENIDRNRGKIVEQIDAYLKNSTNDKGTFLNLYLTILQSLSNSGTLDKQLYDMEIEAKKIRTEINKSKGIADLLKFEIDALNSEKETIRNMAIIKEPEVSQRPVRPNPKEVALLMGLVSPFAFIFLASFIERKRQAEKNKPHPLKVNE